MPANYTLKWGKDRNGKQRYQPDPSKFIFNIDTLWYTYDALNYDSVMDSGLSNKLELGKAFADNDQGYLDYVQVKLPRYEHPVTFEIQPNGQAPLYRYIIRNYDMAFYFSKQRRLDGRTFPVKVQINQFKLWELGVREAFIESLHVLAELGFIHESSKPNRIDPCIHSDQWRWNLSDFVNYEYPRNVAKDNFPNFIKLDPVTGDFETVYFGDRTRLQQRIYNKSKEIKAKQKQYFNDLYLSKGMDINNIWNIEFEVHRDYLKGFVDPVTGQTNIFDTMDFLLRIDGLSLLWTHLVNKFVHPSAFWKVLQKGDVDKFVNCKENMIFRLKDIDSSKEREVAQIRGRLQKLILNEDLPEDADMMIESIKQFVNLCSEYEDEKEKDYEKDVYKKRKRYMDIEMLKLALSEKRKESDDLALMKLLLKNKTSLEVKENKNAAMTGESNDSAESLN